MKATDTRDRRESNSAGAGRPPDAGARALLHAGQGACDRRKVYAVIDESATDNGIVAAKWRAATRGRRARARPASLTAIEVQKRERPAFAGLPCHAPERIRTSDLGFRRPSAGLSGRSPGQRNPALRRGFRHRAVRAVALVIIGPSSFVAVDHAQPNERPAARASRSSRPSCTYGGSYFAGAGISAYPTGTVRSAQRATGRRMRPPPSRAPSGPASPARARRPPAPRPSPDPAATRASRPAASTSTSNARSEARRSRPSPPRATPRWQQAPLQARRRTPARATAKRVRIVEELADVADRRAGLVPPPGLRLDVDHRLVDGRARSRRIEPGPHDFAQAVGQRRALGDSTASFSTCLYSAALRTSGSSRTASTARPDPPPAPSAASRRATRAGARRAHGPGRRHPRAAGCRRRRPGPGRSGSPGSRAR